MKHSTPELLVNAHAFLGEGPAWDSSRQQLYWVDIFKGHLHCFDPHSGEDQITSIGQWVGCVAPTQSGGLILGLKEGIATLEQLDCSLKFISRPESDLPKNRFNDGKCAPNGHFLAGTMDNGEKETTGKLYSLAPDGSLKTLLVDLQISNGLAWSPDYKTFYFIDTPTSKVMAYDYDLSTGEIANPRIAVNIPTSMGWPDGMTSDENGNLWVGLWGGAALSVWNPGNGSLLEKIDIPAWNVTCCVFGGPSRTDLYVTSACQGLDEAHLSDFPQNGGLFRIKTNVTGMPTFSFAAKN